VTAQDAKAGTAKIQITNEKGRLTPTDIERMLHEAEQNTEQDELARLEIIAREELQAYVNRTRRALIDIPAEKISERDRGRLEKKLEATEFWLVHTGDKSTKQECEKHKKTLEMAMATVMLKVNRASAQEFWERRPPLPENEKLIHEGGWFLHSGWDMRELFDAPD